MKLIKNLFNKAGYYLLAFMLGVQMFCTNVYARTNIKDTKAVTGTKDLFTDLQAVFIGLSSIVAAVMIIWQLIKMKMADDDQDTRMYKKKIKIILVCAILVVLVSTLLPAILSYYE